MFAHLPACSPGYPLIFSSTTPRPFPTDPLLEAVRLRLRASRFSDASVATGSLLEHVVSKEAPPKSTLAFDLPSRRLHERR